MIVSIEAETAALRSGLDDAKKQLKEFDSTLKELAGVVEFKELGHMAVELGKQLAELALHGAEMADHMNKSAQAAGLSVEKFSQLAYAASLSGVNADELGVAFSKLNVALGKAGAGAGEQRALFSALGVAVKDAFGNVRGTDEVLADLADRFAGMQDGASKSALAIDVFGKSGAQLLPLLNQGRDGIAELRAEADRLGVTINGSAAQSAERFNDNLEKMRAAMQAVQVRVAAQLTPALSGLTDQLLNSKDGAQALKDLSEVLATTLKVLTTVAVGVSAAFQVAGEHLAAIGSALVHFGQGDLKAVGEDFANFSSDAVDAVEKAGKRIGAIWGDTTAAAKGAGDAAKVSGDKTLAAFEAGKKGASEYTSALQELKKLAADEAGKVASFGLGPLDQLIAKLDSGALTHGIKDFSGELGVVRQRVIELTGQLQEMEFSKFSVELDLKLGQQLEQLLRELATRSEAFANIGVDQKTQTQAIIDQSGFKSFAEALQNYGEQVHRYQLDLADLETAKQHKDNEAIQYSEQILNAQKRAVDVAGDVLGAMQKKAEQAQRELEAAIDATVRGFTAVGSQLVGKLGELGSVIQSGIQGFQSGGPWGALAAVVVELFSRFNRFAELVQFGTDQVEGLISQLSGPLSALTDGFKDFMKDSGIIAQIVGDLLGPAIREVGRVFSHVAQIFAPMLNSIRVMADQFALMTSPLEDLLGSLDVLKPVIAALSIVFNTVTLTILGTEEGILTAFGKLLDALRQIAGVLKLDDLAKSIGELENSVQVTANNITDQINQVMNNIANPYAAGSGVGAKDTTIQATLFDTYMQIGDLGTQAKTTAADLAKMSGELTNVPAGFKYALAKFNAMDAGSGSGVYGATAIGNGMVPQVTVIVQGTIVTEQNLVDAVQKGLSRQNFRTTGTPTRNIPPL